MIQVYKLNISRFSVLEVGSRKRDNSKKIRKHSCRPDLRKYSFSQRVVDFWNLLPEDIVNSLSMDVFKRRLDGYMDREL